VVLVTALIAVASPFSLSCIRAVVVDVRGRWWSVPVTALTVVVVAVVVRAYDSS